MSKSYIYTLGDVSNMTEEQQLSALKARLFPPRYIVGTGYTDTRKVAIEYLEELIAQRTGEQKSEV